MTILDRYITRQFVVAALFGLFAFLMVFVVIDLMEKLDDFIDVNAPTHIVIEYYIAFIPEIVKLMTPVALLLAALFVMGRLSSQNELAAIKASGVSLYRVLLPFLVVSLIVSCLSIYLNGWVVPRANQKKFYIERNVMHQGSDNTDRFNIFFQEGRTRIVSMSYFDIQNHVATRVSIQDFLDTNLTYMERRWDAASMRWLPTPGEPGSGKWVLQSGSVHSFQEDREVVEPFTSMVIGRLTLTPADIEKKQRRPDEMEYGELREFIENQERAGQDVSRWLVDYHAKLAFPFASIIMVLFGVPFASSRPRTGAALGIGICVAVTFIYLGFMKVSQVFGYNGDLNPLVTAWLANIIFLVAAIVNLIRVQK